MYTTDHLYPITDDVLDKALSSLTSIANHHTDAAQLLRAIKVRSGCVGRVFNRSCIEAMQAALPGYSVRYYISDAVKRRPRMLVVIRLDDQGKPMTGPSNHWTLELATADAPKLTTEHLDERIAYHVEQSRLYSTLAADLPAQAAAYNAASAYLQPIKRSIDTAMLYAGI
ncbi:MAG: hypothetical protein SO155_10895 [Candidatus Ventricola sp.]|nr:hypothetical protein [Candidatus Ventricola sp.]